MPQANVDGADLERIAVQALSELGNPTGKAMLYSEIEEGVISADLLAETRPGFVVFKFASKSLQQHLYEMWNNVPVASEKWRTLTVKIDADDFYAELQYDDQVDDSVDLTVRRTAIANDFFGEPEIDYTRRHVSRPPIS